MELDTTLTAGANAGSDPTAGVTAGSEPTGGDNSQGTQPVNQSDVGRTFTQADLDRIVQERVARERRQWEERIRQYEQQLQALYAQQPQYPQFDGMDLTQETEYQLPPEVLEMREQLEDLRLDREIERLSKKYPDFAENETEILQTAVDLGIENLEVAYAYWKMQRFNSQEYEQQIIQRYLQQAKQRAQTPAPQGPGGGMPSGKPKPKTLDEAAKAAMERLKRLQS